MHTLRTRFKNEIVCEFLPPSRATKKQRVIIFADGMPTMPSKKSVLEFFSKKGFWVFAPRYRGTWESDGKFLKQSPHQDVLDVIEQLPKGFTSLWDGTHHRLSPHQLIIIGSSFGGPAGLMLSCDPRVSKVVAVSSVIDWQKPGPEEPMGFLKKFIDQAFGAAYRIDPAGWHKLTAGKLYNPIKHIKDIDGGKILLIHAKDDTICRYSEASKFAKKTGAKLITLPRGGHLGSSILFKPRFQKIFTKFIK